ncbi:MAG: hypothetical protein WCL39_13495 [Armatimonadota bacterium]
MVKGGSSELAHDIAVHIAFTKPSFLRREDVPAAEVDAERATIEEISRNEGKPDAALPKIIEGRMEKLFYGDKVLLNQPFIQDESVTIQKLINDVVAVIGEKIEVKRYIVWRVGETEAKPEASEDGAAE